MKKAEHVEHYEQSFVDTVVFHLSLLKLNCIEVLDHLRKLQQFQQSQRGYPNTFTNLPVFRNYNAYDDLVWNAGNQANIEMESRYTASIVQQIHLLPSLVEVHSNQPSCDEVKDHQNLADNLKKIPETCRLAHNRKEKEGCEEIVGLDQEKKV